MAWAIRSTQHHHIHPSISSYYLRTLEENTSKEPILYIIIKTLHIIHIIPYYDEQIIQKFLWLIIKKSQKFNSIQFHPTRFPNKSSSSKFKVSQYSISFQFPTSLKVRSYPIHNSRSSIFSAIHFTASRGASATGWLLPRWTVDIFQVRSWVMK